MQTVELSVLIALCACAHAAPLHPAAPALVAGPLPAEQEDAPGTVPADAASAAARLKKSAPGTCITVSEPGKAPFTLCNPASSPLSADQSAVATSEARTFGHLQHDEHLFKPKIKFVKVPVMKHLEVPVATHGFEPHYYGGHRSSQAVWVGPEQAFASAPFEASFDRSRAGEQEALARTAIEAEMALQAHLMNQQTRNVQAQMMQHQELEQARYAQEQMMNQRAFEQARHAQAQIMYQQELEQARFAEAQMMYQQQLERAGQPEGPSANVAGPTEVRAHVPNEHGAERARAVQLEQAMNQQAFEMARQAQLERAMEETARSAVLAPSYAPLPVVNNYLPTLPSTVGGGGYAASIFPHSPGGGGCGALPLLFSCSPHLVRGHFSHAAHGGGPVLHGGSAGGSYRETEQPPGSTQSSKSKSPKDEKKSEAAEAVTTT